jgi:hypothetical protein
MSDPVEYNDKRGLPISWTRTSKKFRRESVALDHHNQQPLSSDREQDEDQYEFPSTGSSNSSVEDQDEADIEEPSNPPRPQSSQFEQFDPLLNQAAQLPIQPNLVREEQYVPNEENRVVSPAELAAAGLPTSAAIVVFQSLFERFKNGGMLDDSMASVDTMFKRADISDFILSRPETDVSGANLPIVVHGYKVSVERNKIGVERKEIKVELREIEVRRQRPQSNNDFWIGIESEARKLLSADSTEIDEEALLRLVRETLGEQGPVCALSLLGDFHCLSTHLSCSVC